MSLLDKLKKFEEKKEILPEEKIGITIPIKTPPKERKIITGDKDLNKEEMCNYLAKQIKENQKFLTLDYLRGKKLEFDSIIEMRKIKKGDKENV